MPATYIYVFKWFKVSKKTRKTSEVCKKPVLQNKTGGCYIITSIKIKLCKKSCRKEKVDGALKSNLHKLEMSIITI